MHAGRQACIHNSHKGEHTYTHTCVITGIQTHINPPSHTIHTSIYVYMNNNANSCMHTQHPTSAETHTHAHIHAYGNQTCIYWLTGTNIRHANMRT